ERARATAPVEGQGRICETTDHQLLQQKILLHITRPSRCLDAFSIALNQADSSGWYSSTSQLQLASLEF
ncbi:unnamed protein product, partial [Ascophyllum nodosum]